MEDTTSPEPATGLRRAIFLALGLLFTGLGIVGAFIPLMPTTIFLIVAVAFFARSSRRLEQWLVNHPQLGPPIERWRRHGAIAPLAKALAVGSMAAGLAVFWVTAHPSPWLFAVAAIVIGACAAFVLSRPSGPA